MSDQPPPEVLGALPHRRPQRRSDRRDSSARPDSPPTQREPTPPRATPGPRSERLRQPAQPPGIPTTPRGSRPIQSDGRHILGTAAQAAAELAEIGLAVGVRALRNAIDRLPRP